MALADQLLAAERRLGRELAPLGFAAPVTHIYNPLDYARRPHAAYLRRYARAGVRVLYLGMNPGPFGMAQTGVPFGEVAAVRDWLGIEAPVARPPREHPRRPVLGFACPRSEVSGARLWGAIAAHWRQPARFFRHGFVANYCPLIFLTASGRNRTPAQLPAAERAPLYRACDAALLRLVDLLRPVWVVGVGRFAEQRAREALQKRAHAPRIGGILHPSPANPAANQGWAQQAARQLRAQGICQS